MPVTNVVRRPRRVVARTIGLAGTALLAAALMAWTPTPATGWNQGAAEAKLWQLMNGARTNNGLRPVQSNSTLVSLARWRSKDQVQRDYFDHTVLGTGYQVYHWMDLNGLRYRYGGENIGWNSGYPDTDSAVAIHEGFMASPGHRANILNADWTHGGIGAYAADNVSFLGKVRSPRFFTELFMQALSSSSPPPPPPPPSSGPPPPPPSGGDTRPAAAAAPAPRHHKRHADRMRVETPRQPRSGQPLNGATLLARAEWTVAPSKLAMLAFADLSHGVYGQPSVVLASLRETGSTFRIQPASATSDSLVDSLVGPLMGGFAG